jgi:hypothetical protein
VIPLNQQRPRHIDGAIDRLAQLKSPAAQLHLSLPEARDVEEVVDQPRHVSDLTGQHFTFTHEHSWIAELHHLERR